MIAQRGTLVTKKKAFWKKTTKEQAKDTGMAMVLVLLIAALATHAEVFGTCAIIVLIVAMTVPKLLQPLAAIWFGFSELLGLAMSKVLLTIVFFLIVTPIGLLRRLLGNDSLFLRQFKANDASVFQTRVHTYAPSDLEKPF